MIKTKFSESILSLISKHQGSYPITTTEIQKQLDCHNAVLAAELKKLQRTGEIRSRKVVWVKGYRVFHILGGQSWPLFLATTCGNCHYRSTIKTCIFHNDLSEQGYPCELTRVGVKLSSNTVGCPYYISRAKRWRRKPLEEFLVLSASKKSDYGTLDDLACDDQHELAEGFSGDDSTSQFLPQYYCLFCSYPLYQLGSGFLPLLGSSVIRCQNCESLYKLVYDEKEEKFVVIYAEEHGDLYRQNFEQLAGTPSTTEPYSSNKFGIVIPKGVRYILDKVAEVLIVANWVGRLSSLDYIIARSKKDYMELQKALAKEYSKIAVIDGTEEAISPKPCAEQIGLLRLLRETKLLNASFCRATLESRKTVLQLLAGIVNEEKRRKALKVIDNQLQLLSRYQLLKVKDWNKLEMTAGNAMWQPIKAFLEGEGFAFPGRVLARYVRDPFKPFRLYYAYSAIDTIINGLILKTSTIVKHYCSKINLCWDGLPGLCHKETHGGEFGFHLDLLEPFKLAAISGLCKAILENNLQEEEIPFLIGRRRQRLYYINPESKVNWQLKSLLEETFNQKGTKFAIKVELENYFWKIKLWLKGLVVESYNYQISHHEQAFALWAVMYYQIWSFLPPEQKTEIQQTLKRCLLKAPFAPYVFQKTN